MRQVRRLLFAALMSAASQDAMVLIPMALALCGCCLAGCVLCFGLAQCYVLCAVCGFYVGPWLAALLRRRSFFSMKIEGVRALGASKPILPPPPPAAYAPRTLAVQS